MKTLYVIYDRVAEEGGPPYIAHNDGVAKRMAMQALENNPKPEDFRIYRLAYVEDNMMSLTAINPPEEVL